MLLRILSVKKMLRRVTALYIDIFHLIQCFYNSTNAKIDSMNPTVGHTQRSLPLIPASLHP